MNNLLISDGISKTYSTDVLSITALQPAFLTIPAGSINLIMGKSGSGKTTLLHLLSGMDFPSSGKVKFDGKDLYTLKDAELAQVRGKAFGFVFQNFNLVPELSVYDNICLPLIFTKSKIDRTEIVSLAKELGISAKLDVFPGMLSGGEQQRVAIARAMANEPKIIFADEPTGNLDWHNSKIVIDLLNKMCRQKNLALVIVTHDKDLIPDPDFFYMMEDGKLRFLK